MSGFDQQAGDFSQVPDNVLADANRSINSGAKEQYSALMEALASEENLPLVFHCTHGKDRAGVASAVLLMALGVSEDIAREDYLLSNVYREEQNRTELEKIRQGVATKQGVDPAEVDISRVEEVYYLQSAYFDAMLDEINSQYGSFDSYLSDGLGLDDSQVSELQARLLE